MDCHEALEILDASSAGAWDGEHDCVDAAYRHVAECAQCQSRWPQREQWNRKLAASMQAVIVPRHVYERLHAMLPQSATSAPQLRSRRGNRRWWAATAFLVASVVFAVLLWPAPQTPLRLDDLRVAVDVDVDALPKFAGRFEPRLPKEWEPFFELDRSLVRGFPTAGQPQVGMVGLVPFQFASPRGVAPLRGRLLILTRRQLLPSDVPTAGFSTAPIGYLPSSGGTWLVWAEGDFVYACLVPSGPVALDQFRKLLSASRPLS